MVAVATKRRESGIRGCEYHNWIRRTKDKEQLIRVLEYHTDTVGLIRNRLDTLEGRKSPPPTRHDEGSDWGLMLGLTLAFVVVMAFWCATGAYIWHVVAD